MGGCALCNTHAHSADELLTAWQLAAAAAVQLEAQMLLLLTAVLCSCRSMCPGRASGHAPTDPLQQQAAANALAGSSNTTAATHMSGITVVVVSGVQLLQVTAADGPSSCCSMSEQSAAVRPRQLHLPYMSPFDSMSVPVPCLQQQQQQQPVRTENSACNMAREATYILVHSCCQALTSNLVTASA
jgi:hypothetical protein